MRSRVGLAVNLTSTFGRDLLHGVCRIGHPLGWRFVFVQQPLSDSAARLALATCDGVIGHLGQSKAPWLDIPYVDLELRADEPPPPVGFDEEDIGRSAARHLLDQGLTQLAVVAGTTARHPVSVRRIAGFRQVAQAAGVPCAEFYPSVTEAPELLRQLAPWLAALPTPCGVFGVGDYFANLVLTACHEAGLPVPSRICVIGADNDEILCLLADEPLSSVSLPHAERGAAAALHLQALFVGRDPGPPVVLPPGPVIARASTDALAGSDAVLTSAVSFIRANLTDNLTVSRLATAVGLTRKTLERRFRSVLRRSVHDEIRRIRVDRSMELLATSELPISAIALGTGLSHNAFISAFQTTTGQTPAAWRRARRVRMPA
jgi:LacI family transcriptional regulator